MTDMADEIQERPPHRSWLKAARIIGGIGAVVVGLGLVFVVAALGHCSSFGGSCPADPPPLLEDDVFGTSALGAALAVGVPTWLTAPTVRRLKLAVPVAAGAGVLVGLMARSAAAG